MSVAFRREFLGASATVRVEAAFGADLNVNSAAWLWTDITTDVLYADYAGVTIAPMGKSDGSGQAQPAGFTFAVKNDTGNYTAYNPSSIYYPYVRRQTPIRCVVNLTGNAVDDSIRAQGYANGWVPSWDVKGAHSIVQVSCSGVLRRLQRSASTLQSAIYRSNIAANPVVYAPMEESSGATKITATGQGSVQNALFAGTVAFAGEDTLGGSKPTVVLNGTSYVGFTAGGYNFSNQWQVDWFYKFPGSAPAAETIVMRAYTNSPNATYVDAVFGGVNWGIRTYTAGGTATGSAIFGFPSGIATGWWHWRIMAHDAGGGSTDLQVVVIPVSGGTGSFAPLTLAATIPGDLTACGVKPTTTAMDGVAMAHLAFFDRYNFSAVDASADGYSGENATTRLARLAREEGLELTVSGSSTAIMGPQKAGSVLALLRECETADGGVLYDGRNAGLSYISEQGRYNATAQLTLSATARQISGAPATFDDDQRDVNRVTIARTSGSSFTFEQESGPRGSDTIGVYDDPGISGSSVNLEADDDIYQFAAWRVHLGQADGFRYPQLALNLVGVAKNTGSTTVPTNWLLCNVGSRIDMTNTRTIAATRPPGDVRLIVEGWQESITPKTWSATAVCSSFDPWDVGVADTYWLDCGRSVLGTAMTTGSTTMDVLVSDNCNWTHADGNFSVTVGGEEMTVTAIGATTTPTPALVAVGTKAEANAAAVAVPIPAGATAAGNLLLLLASVRDTNATDTDMYLTGVSSLGWQRIFDGVNMALFAKVHSGSETAPTLNYVAGIAGDTVLAQMASFSGKWGNPRSQLVASMQQANGSAQNIGYPALTIPLSGTLVVWMGWKADDWTSVAPVVTEISEATSTLGNDAGIVWDMDVAVSAVSLNGGSFVVTGGTSQISRGAAVGFRNVYQTLTVTRGVNGITRAHPIGEEVHVTHPLILSRQ